MTCIQVLLLVVLAVVVSEGKKCNLPSHLWCSSRKTAKDCKVTRQCEQTDWRQAKAASPVSLTVYYESMCPFCAMFTTQQLFPAYSKLGDSVLNVTMLPFGNAKMTEKGKKWEFTCQHGPGECVGNLMATCAIDSVQSRPSVYVPFINCMEEHVLKKQIKWNQVLQEDISLTQHLDEEHPKESGQSKEKRYRKDEGKDGRKCAPKFNISADEVTSCMKGEKGNKLEHNMGMATKNAGVLYVPWIVLNGQHTQDIQTEAQHELLKLVCKTYTGPKPPACSGLVHSKLTDVSFKNPRKAKLAKKH